MSYIEFSCAEAARDAGGSDLVLAPHRSTSGRFKTFAGTADVGPASR